MFMILRLIDHITAILTGLGCGLRGSRAGVVLFHGTVRAAIGTDPGMACAVLI